MSKDLKKFVEPLADIFEEQAKEYLEGLKEDLRSFALEIGRRAARALATGRMDLVTEMKDQLITLAEFERVKIVNNTHAAIGKVIDVIFATAVKLIL